MSETNARLRATWRRVRGRRPRAGGLRTRCALALAVFVWLSSAGAAWADLDATIEIIANGATISYINSQPNRTNQIPLVMVDKSMVVPFDAGTGKVTGASHYEPLVIEKRVDAASPALGKAAAGGDVIEAIIRFYPADGAAPYLVMHVSGATIIAHRTIAESGETTPIEQLRFVFQTIRSSWADLGVTQTESWAGPVPK